MFLKDLISRFKIPKFLYENLNSSVNDENWKFSDSAIKRRVTKLIYTGNIIFKKHFKSATKRKEMQSIDWKKYLQTPICKGLVSKVHKEF